MLAVSCGPTAPPSSAALHSVEENAAPVSIAISVPKELPQNPPRPPQAVSRNIGGIPIRGVLFDSRTHRLRVMDQSEGPASRWPDAAAAGRAAGGIAALNAGFFTPEGAPLGIVISNGKRHGSVNRASSLGSGLFVDLNTPALLRREQWDGKANDAVQSGPFLIENGRSVGGLGLESSTARSFIARLGGTRWLIARTGPCSLRELGQALAGTEWDGSPLHTALNLDGGRSSDLWVSGAVQGGPLHERPFWNKPVRNFLVLVPRD